MKERNIFIFILLLLLVIFIFVGFAVLIYATYTLLAPSDCVGIIHINGVISTEQTSAGLLGEGTTGSTEIVNQISDASSRSEIKAVVFEVNSPGGSVVATREIYEAVKDLEKPKVAYFREVAASGGYYVSVGTDYIISDPNAITGSIGVIAIFEDLSGLFQKLGINYTILKSGEVKDMGDPSRSLTEKEKMIMEVIINETFDEFKSAVEQGRAGKLDIEKFNEILDARILTGRQAKRIGLIDELGNEKDAIRKAAMMANMSYKDDPRVCEIGGGDVFGALLGQSANYFIYILRSSLQVDKIEKVSLGYR